MKHYRQGFIVISGSIFFVEANTVCIYYLREKQFYVKIEDKCNNMLGIGSTARVRSGSYAIQCIIYRVTHSGWYLMPGPDNCNMQ